MRCCCRIIDKVTAHQKFDCRADIKFEERLDQKRLVVLPDVSAAVNPNVSLASRSYPSIRLRSQFPTIAREHLSEVRRKLADLGALRRELESLIGQCRHGTIAECRILEALAPE